MKALLAVALSSSLLLGCRQPKVEHQARDPEAERISAEIRKMAGESAQDLDWFTDEITKIPGNALSCNPRIAANRPLHPHFKANAAARRKSFARVGRVSGVSRSLSLSTPGPGSAQGAAEGSSRGAAVELGDANPKIISHPLGKDWHIASYRDPRGNIDTVAWTRGNKMWAVSIVFLDIADMPISDRGMASLKMAE